MASPDPISRLVRELAKLPGIGERSATRLAFHLLRAPNEDATALAHAIVELKQKTKSCIRCMNVTDVELCQRCSDPKRDPALLCVVASPTDLLAVERGGTFRGQYHVLHGLISPLEGVGPEELKIGELISRIGQPAGPTSAVREVILALSPSVEGEATALYLAKLIRPFGTKVSRIASGIPIGGELEYVDQVTIARAMEARRELF